MFDRMRRRLLGWWEVLTCVKPGVVLVVGFVLAAAAVGVTGMRLSFQSDRNALISTEVDWNARFMRYAERFSDFNSLIVAVRVPEGAGGLERAKGFADDLAVRLDERDDVVRRVWHRFRADPVLLRMAEWGEFEEQLGEIEQSALVLRAGNVAGLLDVVMREFGAMARGGAGSGGGNGVGGGDAGLSVEDAVGQIEMLRMLVGMIGEAARGGDLGAARERMRGLVEPWQYLVTEDGALLLVQVEAVADRSALDPYEGAVRVVRGDLEAVLEEGEHEGIEAGLTGLPVMEADEAGSMVRDSTVASAVAGSAIVVLMLAAFGGWRLPALLVLSLLVGIAWSFGFLTLAVGHLQLLSVFFTVILLGLGVDFGIHLLSAYELERPRHESGAAGCRAALRRVVDSVGPGLLTGALTTAAAFGSTMLTDFKGMSEMGLIAGVGVLLCLAAMLFVLPALLMKVEKRPERHEGAGGRLFGLHGQRWLGPVLRRPVAVVVVGGLVMAAGVAGMMRVSYDNNLLELYPENLESVVWQDVVLEHSGAAVMSAASLTVDLEVARERSHAFARLKSVGSVGGIGRIFPADEGRKLEAMAGVRGRLAAALGGEIAAAADGGPVTAAEVGQRLSGMGLLLGFAANRPEVTGEPELAEALAGLRGDIAGAQAALGEMGSGEVADERMAGLHGLFMGFRGGVEAQVRGALDGRPMEPSDLPAFLYQRGVSEGEGGEATLYLVEVAPAEDVWEPDAMAGFVKELREVDEDVTGVPVQMYESGALIQDSYKLAGVLAGVIALLMVWWDFGKLTDALLAMTPVAFGFATLFGVMWVSGESLNPANIIVLPLMFGIGIASGVHVLHRYRQAPLVFPPGLTAGTDKAVILTSVTTIIAFSSMMLAHHRGIRSLGFVLTVGIAMTLIGCLTVTPALLVLRNRWRGESRSDGESAEGN